MNIRNMLLGIAIGDAFGAGVEFQDRDWIRANVDFSQFVNARSKIPVPATQIHQFTDNYQAWDYTDDTEMTIGVLKALMSSNIFTSDLLIQKWREEYNKAKKKKGYGRNGHGSMAWYFSGEKSIAEIRDFQRHRPNPGNAPAMRAVPLGLVAAAQINHYAAINALATHPNIQAVIASQCIARAAEFILLKKGNTSQVIDYCKEKVRLNSTFERYFQKIEQLGRYKTLTEHNFELLCGKQPIQAPYFLAGIKGVPSDSMYTTGCVLYILKHSETAFDALKMSIYIGGDVDSLASITTGIMAGITGLNSLPSYMQKKIEGKNYLLDVAHQFENNF